LVNQCRFSDDGRYLLSAGSDYVARIWKMPTLEEVAVLRGHTDDVEMATWSPDGAFVATASRDRHIRIFSSSGALNRTIAGHESDVLSVEWIEEGRALLSSSDDGTVRRWDAFSGREKARYELGGETDTVVFSDFGTAFAGNDRGAILTLRDGEVRAQHCHDAGIKRLVYRAAGRRLLSAGYDRMVRLWRYEESGDLTLLHETKAPAAIWLRSAAFLDDAQIVFGTFASTYAVYSVAASTWDLDRLEDTQGLNIACSFNGATYAVGDAGIVYREGTEVSTLGSLCTMLVPWAGRLLAGGQLGELYDALSGEVLYRHRSPLNCAVRLPGDRGDMLVVGTYTGEGVVFAANEQGAVQHSRTIELHDNAVKGLACDGKLLFSVCASGAAAFHDAWTLQPVRRIPNAHDKIANGAASLPGGRFVSVSRDRSLRIWTADSCRVIVSPHDHSIKCVAASAVTGLVATGSYDGKLAIYDVAGDTWMKVRRLSRFGVSSVYADDEARSFLATCYDGHLYRIPFDPGAEVTS
jgi:WD40 repeat protein